MEAKLYKTEKENYVLVDPTKGTYDDGYMLGTSRESQYNKLSIKNCESIELGYDLDELAEEWIDVNSHKWSNNNNEVGDNYGSFKSGFQKALETMGHKKFTYNQMVSAITESSISHRLPSLIIQSLQQTEWDVEIEMEKVKDETKIIGSVKGVKGSGHKITTYKSVPKIDSDGCLILKRI